MRASPAAIPAGADPLDLVRRISSAREAFLVAGRAGAGLRPVVLESWRRCLSLGLDPTRWAPPVELDGAALADYRRAHPLAAVMPIVRRLLVAEATDAGMVVAVADHGGRLLWVEGAAALRRRAERMAFVPGARWSEAAAGTNAPGTALAVDREVQVFAAEHLADPVTPWSCTAAPVHAPDGSVLGAVDVTGGEDVARLPALLLVRATVAAIEAELRAAAWSAPSRQGGSGSAAVGPPLSVPRLSVLGTNAPTLAGPGGGQRLRLRHGELLVLLAEHEHGLSGEQLGILLDDGRTAAVTLRADLSRLRTVLASVDGLALRSHPYRLDGTLRSDVHDVRDLLRQGRVAQALARYPGPLLPSSAALGVEELRRRLSAEVRSCVVNADDPELLWTYLQHPDGQDDAQLWHLCRRITPRNSPRVPLLQAGADRLDAECGALPPRRP